MRVVSLEEFLKIDHEVVYSEYDKDVITYELCVKQCNIDDDDWERVNIPDAFDKDVITPDGFIIDEIVNDSSKHGSFNFYIDEVYDSDIKDNGDEDRKFIVWDKEDIEGLIKRLNDVLISQTNNISAMDMFTTYVKEGR
jgi:hypothetical protein